MPLVLRGSVLLPVPIERAWALWLDAARYPQWQGALLAVRDLSGPVSVVGTTYVLDHGPKLKRQVRVVAVERPVRHVIEQIGVGVHDETVATFEPEDGGTRLTVAYYGHLNRVMRLRRCWIAAPAPNASSSVSWTDLQRSRRARRRPPGSAACTSPMPGQSVGA